MSMSSMYGPTGVEAGARARSAMPPSARRFPSILRLFYSFWHHLLMKMSRRQGSISRTSGMQL